MKNPLLFISFIIIFISSCCEPPPDPLYYKEVQTFQYDTIQGIDTNLLSLDLYEFSETYKKRPVIIYVHGGGWAIGDKANKIDNKRSLFERKGYVFVSINYRLSPYPFEINNSNRVKFPTHNIDVAKAIKWVYDNIEQYGGDKSNIALIGHSAGAHLVALTATNHSFLIDAGVDNMQYIKGVVVVDTKMYDVYDKIQNNSPVDMYINAFGTNPQENIEASPIRNIQNGANYHKFLIIKRGNTDRLAKADAFIQALQNANVSVEELNANPYTHTEINDAIGDGADQIVTIPIINFLDNCFHN